MAFETIKTAIMAQLATLPDAGQIVGYLMAEPDFGTTGVPEFVTVVTRNGTPERRRTMGGAGNGKSDRWYEFDIELHLPYDTSTNAGAEQCELRFDARLEAICDMFRTDPQLGGLLLKSEPPQIESDPTGMRYYNNTPMRYRKIRWHVAENVVYGV